MRALVTGAAGFVGRHLVAELTAAGHQVTETDRADGLDILDPEGLDELFASCRPEVVYHLAGQADVGGSWSSPVETFRTNAEGTMNVLLAAAGHGVDRVLAVASADVYGQVPADELPIVEDRPLRPHSPYGASKAAADVIALQAHLGHGLGVIRARPFNHLGPGQSDRFVASALAGRIARNELTGGGEVPVGDLTPRRDFTDVRDVVRAYRLLVERGEPGEAYNVCSGRDVAVQDVADRLVAMAERPMTLVPDPELFRPVDTPVLRGDPSRLQAATGWTPAISLDQTLADVLDDWRKRVREA
ncbi:MAG TPA: GDP-mannose 4,6-dehydratase [Acidimicrobiales bacterium]|nr:GDP-mannose 4,6-dehydratase [Acidimicrobiales bacterium]